LIILKKKIPIKKLHGGSKSKVENLKKINFVQKVSCLSHAMLSQLLLPQL